MILELFERTMPRHLTAAEIFERVLTQGEDIGMPTIYRVLFQLEADLLVERRNDGQGAVYVRRRGSPPGR